MAFSLKSIALPVGGSSANGMGGSGRASVFMDNPALLNPASQMHVRGYFINLHHQNETNYLVEKKVHTVQSGIIVTDSGRGNPIATSVSAFRETQFLKNIKINNRHYQLSLADFVASNLALGAALYYREVETSEEETLYGNNLKFGLLYTPLSQLGLAFTADNILKEKIAGYQNRQFGVGINYLTNIRLRMSLDLVKEEKKDHLLWMWGTENQIASWLVLRLGWKQDDNLSQQKATFGMGLISPRIRLNYALQMDIKSSSEKREQQHSLSFSLPF